MKETELKPCPFCGSEARLYYGDHDMNGVVCKRCGAKIYGFMSRGSAKRTWNRRADNEQRETD